MIQVSESLHFLAHAFHVMSDLMVDFGSAPSREVRARPYVYQQAVLSANIPIHASISVETTHRMPAPSQQPPQPPQQPREGQQPPRQQQQQQPPTPTPPTHHTRPPMVHSNLMKFLK